MSTDIEVHKDGVDGLEDIEASDLTLPILKLNHDKGTIVDNLTNEEHESLDVILLGVFKQRILWPAEPGEAGEGPICRAYDLSIGHPDEEKFGVKVVLNASGFDRAALDEAIARSEEDPSAGLSCADCNLKEWGSHPRNDGPWCNEQWTTPLLIIDEEGNFMPAVMSHQRTALKPLKPYITGFQGKRKPMYTGITRISAVKQRKGTAEYAVPKFQLLGESDSELWPQFSTDLASMRNFLTTPRARRNDGETTAPAPASTAKAPAKPAPKAAPVEAEAVEETIAPPVEDVPAAPPKRSAPAEEAPETPAPPAAKTKPAAAPADEDEVPF
jgi:hypothetical protein